MAELEILKEILEELKSLNSKLDSKSSDILPEAVTVDHIKAYLHIGSTRAYEILNRKEFTRVNDGRMICIPKDQFLAWVEKDWRRKMIGIAK